MSGSYRPLFVEVSREPQTPSMGALDMTSLAPTLKALFGPRTAAALRARIKARSQ